MHYREYDFDESDRPVIYPQEGYGKFLFPVQRQISQSVSTGKDWEWVCPKFIPYVSPEAENKQKRPLFAVKWVKGGKYVLTGSSDGEIIQWNAQIYDRKAHSVHNKSVQSICVTNYEKFTISGDREGVVAYCDSKINRVQLIQAHKEQPVRDLSFSPTSLKFVSCSDDRTAKIFDFLSAKEEIEYQGHGSDVKSCDWHPF